MNYTYYVSPLEMPVWDVLDCVAVLASVYVTFLEEIDVGQNVIISHLRS